MSRIYAKLSVAPVKHEPASWYRAISYLPSNTVGQLVRLPVQVELAISVIGGYCANPEEAPGVRFRDEVLAESFDARSTENSPALATAKPTALSSLSIWVGSEYFGALLALLIKPNPLPHSRVIIHEWTEVRQVSHLITSLTPTESGTKLFHQLLKYWMKWDLCRGTQMTADLPEQGERPYIEQPTSGKKGG